METAVKKIEGEIKIEVIHLDQIPKLKQILEAAYNALVEAQKLDNGVEHTKNITPFHAHKTADKTTLLFKI